MNWKHAKWIRYEIGSLVHIEYEDWYFVYSNCYVWFYDDLVHQDGLVEGNFESLVEPFSESERTIYRELLDSVKNYVDSSQGERQMYEMEYRNISGLAKMVLSAFDRYYPVE